MLLTRRRYMKLEADAAEISATVLTVPTVRQYCQY